MSIFALLTGALFVATVSSAPSSHPGKTKSTSNYAGAVHYGHEIFEVSADIIIPDCTAGLPKDKYSEYTSDGWVGLSAFNGVRGGLIQTGVTCYAYLDGTPSSYAVWTEWAPAPPVFYNSTNFHVGDVVHARVVAHSENSGTTYLENLSTGEKLETSYSNQSHTLSLGDVECVVESQLQLTELGPEGSLGARYTPWVFENAEYLTKDGKRHTRHKFDLKTPDDHLIDTNIGGYKIAEGIFDGLGKLQVNFTTPANYTIPGLDTYP